MRSARVLATLLFVIGCGRAPAPGPPAPPARAVQAAASEVADPVREAVRAKLQELGASTAAPGINVGYVLADGRAVGLATGLADVEAGVALKPGDRMLLGSIGKTYVAAVVLQLVAEGKLDLDEPIARWFADATWFERVPNAASLTLRILMMHRSGIPRHIFVREFLAAVRADPDRVWAPEELVSWILDAPPQFPADSGFAYADTNYILVGMIVEKATGRRYYDELQHRILEPLGLGRTAPSASRELVGLVPGYSSLARLFGAAPQVSIGNVAAFKVVSDGRYFINPQLEWTGGGLVTTAEDLARWGKQLYGGGALEPGSRAAMLKGKPSPPLGGDYGLGVQVLGAGTWGPSYGHEGVMPGYISVLRYFPDHDVAIAVQINTDVPALLQHRPDWYLTQVADALLGQLSGGR